MNRTDDILEHKNVATALLVLMLVVGAVQTFRNELSFNDFWTYGLGALAVLGVGRGLAAKR